MGQETKHNPLLASWASALAAAGIDAARLVSDDYRPNEFGDGEALLDVGDFILRLVRERGQDFVDLAAGHARGEFLRFDDICVALGWRTVADVTSRSTPLPLEQELAEVMRHRIALRTAFASSAFGATRAAVRRAVEDRETAFLAKLSRLADESDGHS